MRDSRSRRAKLNIIVSLLAQAVSLVCGLIVPRMMIKSFGSEAYGTTTSITQFLAYIALLEGGIGGVARAALYKPLAEKDVYAISAVVAEIKRFFRTIACIFVIYVLFVACAFKYISRVTCFDWISTFLLVIVISISTFAQYFIGISYSVLIQAAQKTYINQTISISATILNTAMIILLIKMDCSLIIVKLFSSIVFAMRPISMWLYVRRHYQLLPVKERHEELLSQKWTGLGQHLAYFLHSNTDVMMLTLFVNQSTVAVYSVHNMVVANIQNVTNSFHTGMEALFGDMLAKREMDLLQKTFGYYESLISYVTMILFSVTAVLIDPFVRLYTADIRDVNYVVPLFALLLTVSSMIYCLRTPYHAMIIAAGHFRQTRMAAYMEAVINIVLSVLLVVPFTLAGVAIGTIAAVSFRFLFYAFYLSKHIFQRPIRLFIKRTMVNGAVFVIILLVGKGVLTLISVQNYIQWIVAGVAVTAIAVAVETGAMFVFYRQDLRPIARRLGKIGKRG